MRGIAVLFARRDSIYKRIPGCDVWDFDRDALKWPGGSPIIGHPPCRSWGQLAHFAKPRTGERELATWCVDQIRQFGGVLEHPIASKLWPEYGLPQPGQRDRFGGFTLVIDQDWFGHRAEKSTRLYVVGCDPRDVPAIPLRLEEPTHVIAQGRTKSDGTRLVKGLPGWRPEVSKAEREHTPEKLAHWLVQLARSTSAIRAAA